VAQGDSTQTTTTTASAMSADAKRDAALAYAACTRRHAVSNFPDPGASTNDVRIEKSAPQFKRAERACQQLLPNGGNPSPQEQAQHLRQALHYAACMRRNGVVNFPDSTQAPDGGPDFGQIGPSAGVNPASPQFKAAKKVCHKLLPGSPTGA
jgi:hypothetical protein